MKTRPIGRRRHWTPMWTVGFSGQKTNPVAAVALRSFDRSVLCSFVSVCCRPPPTPPPTCVPVRVMGQKTNPRMRINNPSDRQITCGGKASGFLGNKKRNRWPSGDAGLEPNGRWVAGLSERKYESVRWRCTSSTRQTMVCPFGCVRKVVGANSSGLDSAPICGKQKNRIRVYEQTVLGLPHCVRRWGILLSVQKTKKYAVKRRRP